MAVKMAGQIESWASWLPWLGKTAAKIGVQVGLNSAVPGYGSIVDFGEALYDFWKGNMTSGFFNVGFGLLNFAMFGVAKSFKEGAKASFEKLVKSFGPEFVPIVESYGKLIFEKVLNESGKMTWRKAWHNLFMNIISSGGQFRQSYEVWKAVIESLLETKFTYVFEIAPGILKATKKDLLPVTPMMDMLDKLAKQAVKKYERQLLGLNYGCAFTKGGVKKMFNKE